MINGLVLYKDIIIEPLYLRTNIFHHINGRKVSLLGIYLSYVFHHKINISVKCTGKLHFSK